MLCAVLVMLTLHNVATAQSVECAAAAPVGSRIVSGDTQAAGEAVERLVRTSGVSADLRAIRENVLKTRFPLADVDTTTMRMLYAYCDVVRSDPALSLEQKTARIAQALALMLKSVEGPVEAGRINSRIRKSDTSSGDARLWPVVSIEALPSADATLIRPAPPYVNDSNKYFVVVGTAHSQDDALQLMARLHDRAPQYDFVAYLPYGSNTDYGVMMATWVSRNVAFEVLRTARARVAPHAYLWTCDSLGETC